MSTIITSAATTPAGLLEWSTTTMLLAVATIGLGVYYYFFRGWGMNWARYGVKCPKLDRFFFFGEDFRTQFRKLFQEYGDTVGIEDTRLVLFTVNLDLLRHILIKDFNNFVDRGDEVNSSSPFAKSLFFARGTEWRRHRQIVSPTFSTGKLKMISKLVDKSAQSLVTYLEEFAKRGELVEIKDLSGRYTCEIIAKTAFGLNAKFINNGEAEFLNNAKDLLFSNERTGFWRILLVLLIRIPYLAKLSTKYLKMQYFDFVNLKADKYFGVSLSSTIKERQQLLEKGVERTHVDFLDLLLKANAAAREGKLELAGEDNGAVSKNANTEKGLTEEEMIGHSELIIFAGMETTATTLQMCLYELARNPEIQEKVYNEIITIVKSKSPTQEELSYLTYTEMVLNETMRKYPPVPSVNRMAKETRTYNGITIPKGAIIAIPYFYILNDPKHFPNPDKFDPERFSAEEKEKRDPMAFAVFGHGPRLCLGMRLAYLELKQALVHILRRLKVVLNEKTEPKAGSSGVEFSTRGLLVPKKPIMLAFEMRKEDEI